MVSVYGLPDRENVGAEGNVIRLFCQLGASLALVGYVIWVIVIIWS